MSKQRIEIVFDSEEDEYEFKLTDASGKRKVANTELFEYDDEELWEEVYKKTMDKKYTKNTRNFNKTIRGKKMDESLIFLIPRERGGPSYKDVELEGVDNIDDVLFAPISKGFPMQDVSSFTLGPIVGEGLCLVNAAFSKSICISHIEGGGKLDLKRKNFWKPAKTPTRKIEMLDRETMLVDNEEYNIFEWLFSHEDLWLEEWEKWRKHIALCSMGDFHWTDKSEVIAYKKGDRYLNFVEWKKECYIKPSYDLLPKTSVFQFLEKIYNEKIPLGLVHPKAKSKNKEKPITREFLIELFNDPEYMCCQPYVVAAKLMEIEIF